MAFTHSQQGTAIVITFLRAFLAAMWSFASFCFVIALAAAPLGRSLAFVLPSACSSSSTRSCGGACRPRLKLSRLLEEGLRDIQGYLIDAE